MHHYQFDVRNVRQVNEVVSRFARIKSDRLKTHLASGKQPDAIGWVSRVPQDSNAPVMFSIGDQERIERWYSRLPGGTFGKMQFERMPVAVPPTLTLFVQNPAVDLDRLEIPAHVEVSTGNVPTVFDEWNLKETRADQDRAAPKGSDPDLQRASGDIQKFLAKRRLAESKQ